MCLSSVIVIGLMLEMLHTGEKDVSKLKFASLQTLGHRYDKQENIFSIYLIVV